MAIFEKRVTVYRKKDRETWKKLKDAFRKEGIHHVHAGHYFNDVIAPSGCSAWVDPRDFGDKGKIDRDIYFIEVRQSDEEAARKAALKHGLVLVVDANATVDAADRKEIIDRIQGE